MYVTGRACVKSLLWTCRPSFPDPLGVGSSNSQHQQPADPLLMRIGELIYHSVNVELHKSEQKMLLSGLHTISNITCKGCHTPLGWVYLKANDPAQRYKEGMSCLTSIILYKVC